jgi:hypothetical protein
MMSDTRRNAPKGDSDAQQFGGAVSPDSAVNRALGGYEAYGEKPPMRQTRNQQQRGAGSTHDLRADAWAEPSLLNAPAPRPGFVQRWMRTKLGADDDARNIMRRMNRGWRPRSADTIPAGEFAPSMTIPSFGSVIGVEGMVLVERPAEMQASHEQYGRELADRQMQSVYQMLADADESARAMPFSRQFKSDVSTGQRRAPVADDD